MMVFIIIIIIIIIIIMMVGIVDYLSIHRSSFVVP